MTNGLGIVLLGLLLGIEHSLEPDHLVAVSTLVSERSGARRAGLIGVYWGLGHSLVLLVIGLLVLALQLKIPARLAGYAELLVGVVLILLGARAILRLRTRRLHLHPHWHAAGEPPHTHFHNHHGLGRHEHSHRPVHQGSFLVGMLHGMAGSAALMLLILGTVSSTLQGISYLLAFSTGSIAGMGIVSGLVGVLMKVWSQQVERFQGGLGIAAGTASILIGAILIIDTLPAL